MPKLSELESVEKPVTQWLSKMAWKHMSNEELKLYRRPLSSPVITQILLEKVAEFNNFSPEYAEIGVEQLMQHLNNPSPIIGNEIFFEKLFKGVTLSIKGRDRDCFFIDFDNIWQNSFIVTNQYRVQGSKTVIVDIVLLINGIPLVAIEAKQRARKGCNWLEGVNQLSTYEQRADKLFMCNGFAVVCNGRICKYGIPGASSSYFMEWKDNEIDTSHYNPILKNGLCSSVQQKIPGHYTFSVDTLPDGYSAGKDEVGNSRPFAAGTGSGHHQKFSGI